MDHSWSGSSTSSDRHFVKILNSLTLSFSRYSRSRSVRFPHKILDIFDENLSQRGMKSNTSDLPTRLQMLCHPLQECFLIIRFASLTISILSREPMPCLCYYREFRLTHVVDCTNSETFCFLFSN